MNLMVNPNFFSTSAVVDDVSKKMIKIYSNEY